MSDEAENEELDIVLSDSEHALAQYDSHAAQIIQAFGNLLSQVSRLPADHWLAPVAMTMLEKGAAQLETKPKGSIRAIGKD